MNQPKPSHSLALWRKLVAGQGCSARGRHTTISDIQGEKGHCSVTEYLGKACKALAMGYPGAYSRWHHYQPAAGMAVGTWGRMGLGGRPVPELPHWLGCRFSGSPYNVQLCQGLPVAGPLCSGQGVFDAAFSWYKNTGIGLNSLMPVRVLSEGAQFRPPHLAIQSERWGRSGHSGGGANTRHGGHGGPIDGRPDPPAETRAISFPTL